MRSRRGARSVVADSPYWNPKTDTLGARIARCRGSRRWSGRALLCDAAKARPDVEIVVYERNRPTDAFGFGVVFSDETLGGFEHADRETFRAMAGAFRTWTDITIHHRGHVTVSGGHGFSAIGRRELLALLQDRAAELGVDVRYRRRRRHGRSWTGRI